MAKHLTDLLLKSISVWRLLAADFSAYIARSYKKPAILFFTFLFVSSCGFYYKSQDSLRGYAEQVNARMKQDDNMALDLPLALHLNRLFVEFDDLLVAFNKQNHKNLLGLGASETEISLAKQVHSRWAEITDLLRAENFHTQAVAKMFHSLRDDFVSLSRFFLDYQELYEAGGVSDLNKWAKALDSLKKELPALQEAMRRATNDGRVALERSNIFLRQGERDDRAYQAMDSFYSNLSHVATLALAYIVLYIIIITQSLVWFVYRRHKRRSRTAKKA
jgi:hypothetical protein